MKSIRTKKLKTQFFYVPPSEASRPRCCSNSRSRGDGPGPDHNDYKKVKVN